ncbi:MAG: response regulator [Chloroflexales bacterium]|nr:response regulator [Chloroflexales bacterium]
MTEQSRLAAPSELEMPLDLSATTGDWTQLEPTHLSGSRNLPASCLTPALSRAYSKPRALVVMGHEPVTQPVAPVRRIQPPQGTVRHPLARILVSDDSSSIQQIYNLLLPRYGFEVIATPGGDGLKTLALCHEHTPDLVITDINKPGLNGYQLCQAIRSDPRTAHIPFLFVTAMDDCPKRRLGCAAGIDDYIVKPFLFENLFYRMALLLMLPRDAQEQLMSLTLSIPGFEHYHPVTEIAGPQTLARALLRITSHADWAALTFTIAGFDTLTRAYGRSVANDLLMRLASLVRIAVGGIDGEVVIAHPGYDWRITVAGPALRLDGLDTMIRTRLLTDLMRQLAPQDRANGYMTYSDSQGQIHQAPLPKLYIKRLDGRHGPLYRVRDLWEALDRTTPLS